MNQDMFLYTISQNKNISIYLLSSVDVQNCFSKATRGLTLCFCFPSTEITKKRAKRRPNPHGGGIPGVQKSESQITLTGGVAQQTGDHLESLHLCLSVFNFTFGPNGVIHLCHNDAKMHFNVI